MSKLTTLIAAAAISAAIPTAAYAQAAGPDHAHGQPPAASQPTSPAGQHGQQTGAHGRVSAPAAHQADCSCPCCQMMRQMMMEMHRAHGQAAPAAAPSEHQRHEAQRPN